MRVLSVNPNIYGNSNRQQNKQIQMKQNPAFGHNYKGILAPILDGYKELEDVNSECLMDEVRALIAGRHLTFKQGSDEILKIVKEVPAQSKLIKEDLLDFANELIGKKRAS